MYMETERPTEKSAMYRDIISDILAFIHLDTENELKKHEGETVELKIPFPLTHNGAYCTRAKLSEGRIYAGTANSFLSYQMLSWQDRCNLLRGLENLQ